MPALVDPKTGERFENVPVAEVERATTEFGLVAPDVYEREQRSGGLRNEILTGVESAIATGANTIGAIGGIAGPAQAPIPGSSLVPGAFTPEAVERRETNPNAALAGTLVAEAPTLLIPGGGAGWAARLGLAAARGVASGAIAEGGQSALTGEEFSPARAAFYGVVGEALGGLASGGIGRLMRQTGKEAPSALELGLRKAAGADAADAVGELASSPLKAGKLADNAAELTDRAVTDLADSIVGIEQRLEKAEAAMFSPAAVKRGISKNLEQQQDVVLTAGARLDEAAARLTEDAISPAHAGVAQVMRESVDELLAARSGPEMWQAARKIGQELDEYATPDLPGYAQEALTGLDDMLADAGTWGQIGKRYETARAARLGRQAFSDGVFDSGGVRREALGSLFADGADRASLHAYLESAEAAAKGAADKGLKKSVEAARAALAAGDEVATSKLLRDAFSEKATDFLTKRVVGAGAKYALGAVGLHGGPLGAMAGAALGEAIGPAIGDAVRPAVRGVVDAVGGGFAQEGVVGTLQRLSQSAKTQIGTAGRSMSNAALRASQATISKIAAPTMSVGVARFMGSHDSLRSAFDEKKDILSTLERDPEALVTELAESLEGLQDVSPELHAALAVKTYDAIAYVRTKVPATIGPSLTSPSGVPASQLAIRQFALYWSGATDPSSVVEDVKNNRVRQEQLEALRTVWPDVYNELKQNVLEGLAASRPTPAQRQRMDLLFDFGPTLDAALSWGLAVTADGARQARLEKQNGGKVPGSRSTRSTAAAAPEGIRALSNPQTLQV